MKYKSKYKYNDINIYVICMIYHNNYIMVIMGLS